MAVTENPYRTPRDVLTAADSMLGLLAKARQELIGFCAEIEIWKRNDITLRAQLAEKELLVQAADCCEKNLIESIRVLRAEHEVQLAEKEAEAKRLREERDHYRALALGLPASKGEGDG